MNTTVQTADPKAALLEQVLITGDLSKLSVPDRLRYYQGVCESVGLNPLTKPFDYITLNGKLTLYAKRDATDQLRSNHGVSIVKLERETVDGCYVVTAYAENLKGRTDSAIGVVAIDNLKGEARANAMMKAETKAKRRVTLSICGLGMMDETEIPAENAPPPTVSMPQPRVEAAAEGEKITEQQHKLLRVNLSKAAGGDPDLLEALTGGLKTFMSVEHLPDIPKAAVNDALAWISDKAKG